MRNCQYLTSKTHTRYKQTWRMYGRNLLLIAMTVFQVIIPVFMRKVKAQKKIDNKKNPPPYIFLIRRKAKIMQ